MQIVEGKMTGKHCEAQKEFIFVASKLESVGRKCDQPHMMLNGRSFFRKTKFLFSIRVCGLSSVLTKHHQMKATKQVQRCSQPSRCGHAYISYQHHLLPLGIVSSRGFFIAGCLSLTPATFPCCGSLSCRERSAVPIPRVTSYQTGLPFTSSAL
jgi:hypothetical protein